MAPSGAGRPRVDHPVDRPELYGPRGLEVTGTNGRSLDRFYRRPSNPTVRRVADQRRDQVNLTNHSKSKKCSLDEGGVLRHCPRTLVLAKTDRTNLDFTNQRQHP